MHKFLLFSGQDSWEPMGGWDDFNMGFDTFEEAFSHAKITVPNGLPKHQRRPLYSWWHIVETNTWTVCADSRA